MPNKYASVERRVIAMSVHRSVINPPNDYDIAVGSFSNRLFTINQQVVNPQTNFIIRRAGLFCNFADGLVWGDGGSALNSTPLFARIVSRSYTVDTLLTGTLTRTVNSLAFTGAASSFTTELSANDVIIPAAALGLDGQFPSRIASVTDDTNAVLKDPPERNNAGNNWWKLSEEDDETFQYIQLRQLNEMIDVNESLPSGTFGDADAVYVTLEVEFLYSDTLNFLTKSIDPAFANDYAIFDVHLDIEYTAR